MSLIENALEKLRRSAVATATDSLSSRSVAAATASHPAKFMALDLARVRAAGYLPEETVSRQFADYYRNIKRPLIERALSRDSASEMRLILITSSTPGDGKTFTSINLALSMARERDISVLLVDADTPKSNVSRVFGIQEERGLIDVLLDESLDPESVIIRSDIRGLDILSAGKPVEHATELLASTRMMGVAAQLARNPRRIVLFDSPPVLGSSEARALLRIPGQVVLVVRADATPTRALMDAIAQIDEGKLQGLVLNHAKTTWGGGYYYGYSTYGAGVDGTASLDR